MTNKYNIKKLNILLIFSLKMFIKTQLQTQTFQILNTLINIKINVISMKININYIKLIPQLDLIKWNVINILITKKI